MQSTQQKAFSHRSPESDLLDAQVAERSGDQGLRQRHEEQSRQEHEDAVEKLFQQRIAERESQWMESWNRLLGQASSNYQRAEELGSQLQQMRQEEARRNSIEERQIEQYNIVRGRHNQRALLLFGSGVAGGFIVTALLMWMHQSKRGREERLAA